MLILVSSRSKISIPSRRPFVHVMGNVCPFDTCVPLVGYVTRKSSEGKCEKRPKRVRVKRNGGTYNHALQGEEGRERG